MTRPEPLRRINSGWGQEAVSKTAGLPHYPRNVGVHRLTAEVDETAAIGALALEAVTDTGNPFTEAAAATATGDSELVRHGCKLEPLHLRNAEDNRPELLQRRIDRRELGAQLGAEPVHDGDDRQRNTGRNQAVLNGGRCGFVR